MNIIESIIEEAADTAEKQEQSFENCYKDSEGYFVCNVCGKRKQFKFRDRLVPAQCECEQEQERRLIAQLKQEQRIDYLFETGVTDKRYLRNTFEKDDGMNPQISEKCHRYVEKWQEMKRNNIGILFYGDVGTGKSFLACCIGNALIKKGIPVLITNLSKLVENRIQANKGLTTAIDLRGYSLLILDDLGIENATQTAYNIIDEWYRTGRPLIVTTNLKPEQLKNAKEIERRRIFDRVVEMCGSVPIQVKGGQRRYGISQKKKAIADSLLNWE